jgi:hypothetical protein
MSQHYFKVLRGYEATGAEEETKILPSSEWGIRNPIRLCGGVVHSPITTFLIGFDNQGIPYERHQLYLQWLSHL